MAAALTCPKCQAELTDKAIVCPQCGVQLAKAQPETVVLTTGQKIAAAVFILNGLCLIAELYLSKGKDSSNQARPALISIVLGGYLFTSKASALKWAKIATVLGGVVYTVLNYFQGGLFGAVLQLFFSLSLAGLIFGQAGKVRLAFSCFFLLCYFSLEGVGLYQEYSPPPLEAAAAPASQP